MREDARTYPYNFYEEATVFLPGPCPTSPDGTWGLQFGIHSGTLMSRDDGETRWGYASYEESLKAIKRTIAADPTYYIWYANAISPDGKRFKIVDGAYYSR